MHSSQHHQLAAQRATSRPGGPHATAERLDGVLDVLDEMWSVARGRGLMRMKPTQLGIEVRRVAVAARAADVLPEHLLWIVKETWSALPEVRAAADPEKARDQLSAIITLCIHEYYRD